MDINRDRTVSGKEFNATNKEKLYKLTSQSANHRGVIYKRGRVNDILPWDPGSCTPGGLYVTTYKFINQWKNYNELFFMARMFEVSIPDDAKVVTFKNKIKASSIIVEKEVTEEYLKMLSKEERQMAQKSHQYEIRAEAKRSYENRLKEIVLSGKVPVGDEFDEIYRQMLFECKEWYNMPPKCKNYRSLFLYFQRNPIWDWKIGPSDIKIIEENKDFFNENLYRTPPENFNIMNLIQFAIRRNNESFIRRNGEPAVRRNNKPLEEEE